MLEIEHPCPRVAEIRYPRESGCPCQFHGYQMHRMRRTCADDYVHRMPFQIFPQESHGWPYPETARIRDEKVGPDRQHQPLHQGLVLRIDRIHLIASSFRCRFLPEQAAVCTVRLEDMPSDDFGFGRYLVRKSLVHCQHFRIRWGVDDGLPAFCRQIFGEFDPSLHSGTSCRRPVIRYYQCPFHCFDRQM